MAKKKILKTAVWDNENTNILSMTLAIFDSPNIPLKMGSIIAVTNSIEADIALLLCVKDVKAGDELSTVLHDKVYGVTQSGLLAPDDLPPYT